MLLVGSSQWIWKVGAVPPLAGTLHRVSDGEARLPPGMLPYREGTYYLFLIPNVVTQNSAAATNACVGGGSGVVRVPVTLSRDGDDWVGKSAPQDGSLAIRLRRAAGTPTLGWFAGSASYRVVGTMSGAATNSATSFRFDDRRRLVSLNADAMIEGSAASGFISDGLVIGDVVFASPGEVTTRCSPGSVWWWMTRPDAE